MSNECGLLENNGYSFSVNLDETKDGEVAVG